MKASILKSSFILLSVIPLLGLVLTGCKKETPPPQEQAATAPQTQDQAAKEKEFLSSPDTVTCELKKTTLSKLDLPQQHTAFFIHRMDRNSDLRNAEALRQSNRTAKNQNQKIILGSGNGTKT